MRNKFYTVRGYQILNKKDKMLTSAMEDYLEMIYRCSRNGQNTGIAAISAELNVQAPSTTDMVQKLASHGLINYRKHQLVSLTKAGEDIGKFLYERHTAIEQFLRNIGAQDDLLEQTELIEHFIKLSTLKRINLFNAFFANDGHFKAELDAFADTNDHLLNDNGI
ncbi:MAG: iron dependent repressor, metal binding and dimerization domain protein [Bacillota bacterium]|nr:iron dependent repressor, metal binding and dimerization domain protein [Bacillota bacterium]